MSINHKFSRKMKVRQCSHIPQHHLAWKVKICGLCCWKRNPANKSPWSHACSSPGAAANTHRPLDLREVEHGLPHVRNVHFFQVLEGLHCREGAISWRVREPGAQHPGQGLHHRVQLGSLCAGKERRKKENSGICALQVAVSCLHRKHLRNGSTPAPRWEMGNTEQSPNHLLAIHRALLQVLHF